ncbi:MAG TPA: hypothetical protein PLE78_15090 [Flavobacteriales bacterium]|nr:hypothetical protein [Flavobacteriales bacterium]
MNTKRRRIAILLLIAGIMICCTTSAVLGLQSGHTARAASTFFAGLTFSSIFWMQLPKREA